MELKSRKHSYAGVKGATVINHRIKIKLDISIVQYVVLDFLFLFKKENNRIFNQVQDQDEMYKHMGARPYEAFMTFDERCKIYYAINGDYYQTTSLWDIEFEDAIQREFEKFWELYGKIGNKKNAEKMYLRTRKEVTEVHLQKRLEVYNNHLNTERFSFKDKMHLSSWLNPKLKKFNDVLIVDEKETTTSKNNNNDGEIKFGF